MKRNNMLFVMMISLVLSTTGCGKAETTNAQIKEEATVKPEGLEKGTCIEETETKEPEAQESETETSKAEVMESDWIAGTDQKQEFPVNLAAYYTKDFGLTVGYSGEIHYTTDGGANWPQAENRSNCCFGLEFVNENVIYVSANGRNVVKSTDGGKNFTRIADFGGTSPNQGKLLSFYDEDNGIIASICQMAITNDGGNSWNELKVPTKILAIYMKSLKELYYVGDDFNMYKSEDGGQTWNSTPLNLPEKDDYIALTQTIAFSVDENGYTVFATQKSTKLLKSYVTTDNCATWTEKAMPEVSKHYHLYLNRNKDVLTANDIAECSAITLYHK